MRVPILALLLLTAVALPSCSGRGLYEGLRQGEAMRQDRSPGEPPRTSPDVGYDEYQAERERLSPGTGR